MHFWICMFESQCICPCSSDSLHLVEGNYLGQLLSNSVLMLRHAVIMQWSCSASVPLYFLHLGGNVRWECAEDKALGQDLESPSSGHWRTDWQIEIFLDIGSEIIQIYEPAGDFKLEALFGRIATSACTWFGPFPNRESSNSELMPWEIFICELLALSGQIDTSNWPSDYPFRNGIREWVKKIHTSYSVLVVQRKISHYQCHETHMGLISTARVQDSRTAAPKYVFWPELRKLEVSNGSGSVKSSPRHCLKFSFYGPKLWLKKCRVQLKTIILKSFLKCPP